jgi:hypothetical protein
MEHKIFIYSILLGVILTYTGYMITPLHSIPDVGISKGLPLQFATFPGFINAPHVWSYNLAYLAADIVFWYVVSLLLLYAFLNARALRRK